MHIAALLLVMWLAPTALADDPSVDVQLKHLETAIAHANQEQQALHLQVQLILELRRTQAEYFATVMPQAGMASAPMNYDDIERLKRENQTQLREHSEELNRLYGRFREIEEERKRLREELNSLLNVAR